MTAAIRPMLAMAKEEASILTADVASVARTSLVSEATVAARSAGQEVVNPLAIREAAEASAKQATTIGESSILHTQPKSLSLGTALLDSSASTTNTTATTTTATITSSTSTAPSLVSSALERDLGVTISEAMANAGQTGAGDVAEQVVETATALLEGKMGRVGAGTAAGRGGVVPGMNAAAL